MTETRRLFIAVPVPDNLKDYLEQQQPAYAQDAVRFVPAANLHLTVHFLGETPATKLPAIVTAMQQVAANHSPFTLELEQVEPGPKPQSPRLIWARFGANAAFSKLCTEMLTQLGLSTSQQAENIPHITLARFRKNTPKPIGLPVLNPGPQKVILPVNSLALWQSELKSPHPVYRVLLLFPLTGAANS